jgi:hypothetical protein
MHPVSVSGNCHVESIVNNQRRCKPAASLQQGHGEFIKLPTVEVLFAQLNRNLARRRDLRARSQRVLDRCHKASGPGCHTTVAN